MTAHRMLHDSLIATREIVDPGTGKTVPITNDDQYLPVTTAANATETRLVADPPRAGLRFTASMYSFGAGSTCAIQNSAGSTFATMNSANDWVSLYSIKTSTGYAWILFADSI